MGRKIVPLRRRQKKGAPAPSKPLTLADIRVTHTIGSRSTTRTGATIAQLTEATQHLHDPDGDDLDFLNAAAVAIELDGIAAACLRPRVSGSSARSRASASSSDASRIG